MPCSVTWKYRFYLVNSVHFDNLSGMNKVFLFKGEMVCFHECFGFLRAHSRLQSCDLSQDTGSLSQHGFWLLWSQSWPGSGGPCEHRLLLTTGREAASPPPCRLAGVLASCRGPCPPGDPVLPGNLGFRTTVPLGFEK